MRPASGLRLRAAVAAVGLLAFASAAAGIPVRAAHGAQTTADEPQYLLTAISLAEDRSLDVADELAAGRWRAFHAAPLPEQTRPLPSGRRLSPHDPLLPLLLALPVALGGWVGAKLAMAALAGLLAGLLLWTAVRRLGVPVATGTLVVAVFVLSPPLAVYGSQLYPELPAALAVLTAFAALTRPPAPAAPPPTASRPAPPAAAAGRGAAGWGAIAAVGIAVVALPWLAVKYVPVAAVLGLLAVWRLLAARARRRALALVAGLVAAGFAYLLLHRWWYGGWTPYAAGGHFAGGELTAAGTDPDYLGRSRRLLGLVTDRTFGLAAWQPAWLLAVPALAALARRRPPGWAALAAPLAAGWLVATFVALTMHGWWFPGRQVVVVLPLAALAVAWWATPPGRPATGASGLTGGKGRLAVGLGHLTGGGARRLSGVERRRGGVAGSLGGRLTVGGRGRVVAVAMAGGIGVVAYAWLVVDGLAGRVTWAVDFFRTGDPAYRVWRLVLPDYLVVTATTWVLHAAWLVVVAVWAAAAWRGAGTPAQGAPAPTGQPSPPVRRLRVRQN